MCQPGRPRPHGLSQPGCCARRGLPQHEVGGVLLVGRHVDPGAGHQLVARVARQAAVVAHARHAEQHMAFGGIGMPLGDQLLDHGDHRADILGGARLEVGRERAQPAHVALVGVAGARGQRLDALVVVGRPHHDAVVDVGDVAHVGDARIAPLQQAIEHVERHDGARIADMDVVVDGRAADIHPHMPCIDGCERFFFARQRVVDDEGHGPYSPIKIVRSLNRPEEGRDFSYIAQRPRRGIETATFR